MTRRERHDCTCGGIAPGYPMHEFFCGRPEPYDPPSRQEQQMNDRSSDESTTEDMWQRLRSAAQAASEATAELDAALKRLVAARSDDA